MKLGEASIKKGGRHADDFNGSRMSSWPQNQDFGIGTQRKLPVDNLKCCPLCGVLNAVQNAECFVCRWHGGFDHDPSRIEGCLMELLDRCPELADAMSEPEPERPTLMTRLQAWWRGLFRRKLDMSV